MEITYEQVRIIMGNWYVISSFIIAYVIAFASFLLLGIFRSAKTAHGRIIPGTRLIGQGGYWLIFLVWGILLPALLIILVIFPLPLKLLGN